MAREMGARDPDALGDALMLLMDGSYFTRLVFPGNSGPVSSLLQRGARPDRLAAAGEQRRRLNGWPFHSQLSSLISSG